jgi:PAS domain S-box-containing protein
MNYSHYKDGDSPFKRHSFFYRKVVRALSLFLLVVSLFLAWGYYYYRQERKALVDEKRMEVDAIAGMKLDMISAWQNERMAEVEFFSSTEPFTDYISQMVDGDTSSTAIFRKNLNAFMRRNGYDEIVLMLPDGSVLFSASGNRVTLGAESCRSVDDVFNLSEVMVQEIYYCREHNKAHYEWIAPVRDRDNELIAVMVFRIDPNDYLFPVVEMWPETGTSGESFILRFEEDSVRVLTPLKYRENEKMSFMLPVEEVRKKFALNRLDSLGFFEGPDYSGNKALGKVVRVKGADWIMVVKLDMHDVLSGLHDKLPLIYAIGFIFFLLMMAVAVFIFYARKRKSGEILLKERSREEEFRRKLAELRSELLSFSSKNDINRSLRHSLNRVGEVTGSPVGFVHFLEKDQNNILFTAWSDETERQFATLIKSGITHNPVEKAGVWANAVREMRPVVHNNFAEVSGKRGMPEGHPEIVRELVVPVIREARVVAVLGIGNKELPYDGDDIYLASYLSDILWEIAEGKFKEESLKKSEEKYRKLFDEHTAIKLLIDPETGNILDVNKAAEIFYGWSVADFRLKKIYDIVVRKGAEKITSLYDFLSFKTPLCEMVHLKKDGSRAVAELFSSKVATESGTYLHAIVHDITSKFYKERAQEILYKISRSSMQDADISALAAFVREQLSGLLDVDNFYVALHNPAKNTLKKVYMVNQNYTIDEWSIKGSLSGYVFSTTVPLLLREEEREEFIRENGIDDVPEAPAVWLGAPLVIQGRSAGVVVLKNYSDKAAYDTGALMLLEMVAHEISVAIGRSLMIKDLTEARNSAQESDRMKSAFIANISHEIKTPLNALLGFMDLLSDSSLDQKERESYISVIKQSGQRLVKTIANLLEASKIQSGNIKVVYSQVSLKEMLDYFSKVYSPQAEAKGVELSIEAREELLSGTIKTDRDKLEGILDNLLSNALKFTLEGRISLNIYPEGKTLFFSVSDTGIGMGDEDLERLFIPFHIADIELTRNHDGTGLGMPIVKSYVEALGGTIYADSGPEKGTTVIFTLPCL